MPHRPGTAQMARTATAGMDTCRVLCQWCCLPITAPILKRTPHGNFANSTVASSYVQTCETCRKRRNRDRVNARNARLRAAIPPEVRAERARVQKFVAAIVLRNPAEFAVKASARRKQRAHEDRRALRQYGKTIRTLEKPAKGGQNG